MLYVITSSESLLQSFQIISNHTLTSAFLGNREGIQRFAKSQILFLKSSSDADGNQIFELPFASRIDIRPWFSVSTIGVFSSFFLRGAITEFSNHILEIHSFSFIGGNFANK